MIVDGSYIIRLQPKRMLRSIYCFLKNKFFLVESRKQDLANFQNNYDDINYSFYLIKYRLKFIPDTTVILIAQFISQLKRP